MLWGRRDRYLGEELATPSPALVPECEVRFLDASHWVHWDKPDEVSDALLEFLRRAERS